MKRVTSDFRVMTSGAFTAAYLALVPRLEQLVKAKVVTVTTSVGTGDISIESRLKRGEVADIVIIAEPLYHRFAADGLVQSGGHAVLARSIIAMAVRAGAPKPDIGSAEALRKTLLAARSIGYSASESGKYFTTQLVQRLGIADEVLPRSRLVGGGVRVGALVAKGEVEIGFQQLSELLPIEGIAHITPLPAELQKVTQIVGCAGATCPDAARARSVIEFLASPATREAVTNSGLEPVHGG